MVNLILTFKWNAFEIKINSHDSKRATPSRFRLALECQKLLYDLLCISFIVSDNPIVFSYMWNHQICSHYQGFVTHFRFTADEKFYPRIFLYQHRMRLSISEGVPWNIFCIQGWLVPEKCILEAFGTGVPARKVTVKILNRLEHDVPWLDWYF